MCYFTIIIPTFNRANRITNTIQSALSHSFNDFELIIVDDGSTDNTEQVVRSIPDQRIKYFKKKNEERAAARNFGVTKASGQYVTFLDSDDLFYPDALAIAHQFIVNHQPEIFHISYDIRDDQGKLMKSIRHSKAINNSILGGNMLSCIGVFARREIFLKHPFHEDRALSGSEDWLLWLQLAARFKIMSCNTVSAALIQHPARSVMSFDLSKLIARTDILVNVLDSDDVFIARYGQKTIENIRAHMLSYIALHASIAGQTSIAVTYLFKAIRLHWREAFQKRTLAIIKHLL